MKVMIINGSPKKKLGTSKYIQKTIKLMLGSTETYVKAFYPIVLRSKSQERRIYMPDL